MSSRRSGLNSQHGLSLPAQPGLSLAQCRAPEVEAAKLARPGVRVIRSAREAQTLLAELGGASERWRRLPRTADGAVAVPMPAPTPIAAPAPAPAPRPSPRPPGPTDLPRRADAELELEVAYLRALAEMRGHWAMATAARHADHCEHTAHRLQRLERVLAVAIVLVALVALVAVSAGAAVTILVVGLVVLGTTWVARRRYTIRAEEASTQRHTLAQAILASHDVRRPVHAADEWSGRLQQLGLGWFPPDDVEAAIGELRRRRRLARATADPVPERMTRPSPRKPPEPVAPARQARPGHGHGNRSQREHDDADGSIEAVVAIDDNLYVGQRMALRGVTQRLAARLPVLVLTTNVRLWQQPDTP